MARLPNQNLTPGFPARPSALGEPECVEWDRIVQELKDSNVRISKVHRALIEQAACLAVEISEARDVMERDGAYLPNEKTGVIQAHPAAKRMDRLRRDYIRVMSALGMRSAPVVSAAQKTSAADLLNA